MSATVPERPTRRDQIGATTTDLPPGVPDRGFFGHPRGLATLFTTEMWERFSFYGIRPLLILFMTAAITDGGFGFAREQAAPIVGIYAASVYLSSLPGGWVADRLFGLRRAVLIGAVLITLGHLSIGLSGFAVSKTPFFVGLILIVLGTGLLKPNISAMVGDLYPEGGARRDAGFSIFYMGINLGAFLGQLVAGALGENVSWHWGFGVAGIGMFVGLLTFSVFSPRTLGSLGSERSRHPDPATDARQRRRGTVALAAGLGLLALAVVLAAVGVVTIDAPTIARSMTVILGSIAVLYFGYLFLGAGLNGDEKKRIAVVFVLFVFAAVFWAAFEQAPTSLNLFARDFTDRRMFGIDVPATAFQSVNSAFIIIFAPVFAALWLGLARRGIDLSSPAKFAFGLAITGLGFGIMIIAANALVESGGTLKVSPWWLIVSYLFQTFGELSISPVGLSSMTKLAPRKFVGQMMGVWFLATSVGNLIAGLVGGRVDPEKLEQTPALFTWTTVALFVSAAIIAALIVPIRQMMATSPTRA